MVSTCMHLAISPLRPERVAHPLAFWVRDSHLHHEPSSLRLALCGEDGRQILGDVGVERDRIREPAHLPN